MHLIRGVEQEDDQEKDVPQLPAPGYARVAGEVHVVTELRDDPLPPIAACGARLRGAELWRRRPGGRLRPGCFGGEAVAVAVRARREDQ